MPSFVNLPSQAAEFAGYLDSWLASLPWLALKDVFDKPEESAILSVDVIKGFCNFGPLASPRVGSIVTPIAALMRGAWEVGVRSMALTQDTHEADAVEFGQWPAHCIRGTDEAEAVDELAALPFFGQLAQIPKNSIHSGLNTGLNAWLAERPGLATFVVVGDCTDLCTYQLAMYLRLDANARQLQRRVIVPLDCVETYDRPVAAAQAEGGLPHPGDLLHAVFLYHMALNGVEVVLGLH
jgi:nicotinamidase-related amidase